MNILKNFRLCFQPIYGHCRPLRSKLDNCVKCERVVTLAVPSYFQRTEAELLEQNEQQFPVDMSTLFIRLLIRCWAGRGEECK